MATCTSGTMLEASTPLLSTKSPMLRAFRGGSLKKQFCCAEFPRRYGLLKMFPKAAKCGMIGEVSGTPDRCRSIVPRNGRGRVWDTTTRRAWGGSARPF